MVFALLLTGACGASEPYEDVAPQPTRQGIPRHDDNLTKVCESHDLIYIYKSRRGNSMAVVPNSPRCP